MTWKTRMGGFLTKSDHMFLINKMKTNSYDNPTMVHEVQSDFVCLKENFGINSKMFALTYVALCRKDELRQSDWNSLVQALAH